MRTMKEAKAIKLDCTFVVNIPTDNLPKMAVCGDGGIQICVFSETTLKTDSLNLHMSYVT